MVIDGAQVDPPGTGFTPVDYRPGVCNIGPAEIRRRRRMGHLGVIAALALLVVLLAIGASPVARLIVGLPAAVAASGYLQAYLKFCAGFGSRGVFNFGLIGQSVTVADEQARAADRRMAGRISAASAAIGGVVAVVAVLIPA
jgi:hypothetical protein